MAVRHICFIYRIYGLNLLHKAGRMMMNLRGLMLDDPEHTVHLHTLRFADYHDSGLWIEEGTLD
jgi:hypothetical protein